MVEPSAGSRSIGVQLRSAVGRADQERVVAAAGHRHVGQVDDLRVAARDLDPDDRRAGRRGVERRGAEGGATVGRSEDRRQRRAATVGDRRRRRQNAHRVGRVGEEVGDRLSGEGPPGAPPAARFVIREGEPRQQREGVEPIGRRRSDGIDVGHRRGELLAGPDPAGTAVVRQDEAKRRGEADLLRLVERQQDAQRSRNAVVRARDARTQKRRQERRPGCPERSDDRADADAQQPRPRGGPRKSALYWRGAHRFVPLCPRSSPRRCSKSSSKRMNWPTGFG